MMKRPHNKIRERNRFFNIVKKYGADIMKSPNFRESENCVQHGTMSVRRHSINVARCSFAIARFLGIKYNKRDLLRGALLHDYFQYDWHSKEHRNVKNLHGFYHPGIALKNAEQEYRLNKRQREIIKKHMWPLTIVPPMCKEAWIVTIADKYCSVMETLYLHNGKSEKESFFFANIKEKRAAGSNGKRKHQSVRKTKKAS